LELGRLLVSEYLQERDGDTLSRWFLHAIAEKLIEFNEAKGEKARKSAQDTAADLILRFWRHRKATNLNVDPLSRFEELFKSLELLIPKANPWMSQRVHQTEKLAAELFECLSSLTIGLMLLGLSESDKPPRNSNLFARFLPTNEQGMLRYFEFVERSLTTKETVTASEAVPLKSKTVIETVQAWTALTRTKLDQLDRILSDAVGKLPKSADSPKKRDSKKTPRNAPAKKATKKNSTVIKNRRR